MGLIYLTIVFGCMLAPLLYADKNRSIRICVYIICAIGISVFMGLAWYEFTDHMESIYTYPQTMLMGFMYVILLFMITFFSFGYETEEDTLSGHCKKK